MFVIPELKLNSFEDVVIPAPSDLFARFGFTKKTGSFSGDDTPATMSKVEAAKAAEDIIIDRTDD